jgi:hypothetical protein
MMSWAESWFAMFDCTSKFRRIYFNTYTQTASKAFVKK